MAAMAVYIYIADIAKMFWQILIDPAMDHEENRHRDSTTHSSSFELYKQGTTSSIFELDSISSNYNLCMSILGKFKTTKAFPSGNYCYKF